MFAHFVYNKSGTRHYRFKSARHLNISRIVSFHQLTLTMRIGRRISLAVIVRREHVKLMIRNGYSIGMLIEPNCPYSIRIDCVDGNAVHGNRSHPDRVREDFGKHKLAVCPTVTMPRKFRSCNNSACEQFDWYGSDRRMSCVCVWNVLQITVEFRIGTPKWVA